MLDRRNKKTGGGKGGRGIRKKPPSSLHQSEKKKNDPNDKATDRSFSRKNSSISQKKRCDEATVVTDETLSARKCHTKIIVFGGLERKPI